MTTPTLLDAANALQLVSAPTSPKPILQSSVEEPLVDTVNLSQWLCSFALHLQSETSLPSVMLLFKYTGIGVSYSPFLLLRPSLSRVTYTYNKLFRDG